MRKADLRRNVWRYSTRTEVLRKRTSTTKVIFYSDWDATVFYRINDRVKRDNRAWICIGEGINNDPLLRTYDKWTTYFGSDTLDVYAATTTYSTGEQIYSGTAAYISIVDTNLGQLVTDTAYWLPIDIAAWVQFSIYALGDRVTSGGLTYVSIQAANQNNAPASSPTFWVVTSPQILRTSAFQVPSANGLNIFRLPTGFLREAPQNPKQGSYTPFGAPSANPYGDFVYQGNYFMTQLAGPINFRFATVCEILTQSGGKLQNISATYRLLMSEARIVNGIEVGAIEAPEDSYLSLRT
jgi:hypothetical protein